MDLYDELLAKRLQAQYDQEERNQIIQQGQDRLLAHQIHTVYDSDSSTSDILVVHSKSSDHKSLSSREHSLIHCISDSDDDGLILKPTKRRRNSSKDSDETLDPNEDWDLYVERSKPKNIKATKRKKPLSDSDDQDTDGDFNLISDRSTCTKAQDNLADTGTDSDVTIDYSPQRILKTDSDSDSTNMNKIVHKLPKHSGPKSVSRHNVGAQSTPNEAYATAKSSKKSKPPHDQKHSSSPGRAPSLGTYKHSSSNSSSGQSGASSHSKSHFPSTMTSTKDFKHKPGHMESRIISASSPSKHPLSLSEISDTSRPKFDHSDSAKKKAPAYKKSSSLVDTKPSLYHTMSDSDTDDNTSPVPRHATPKRKLSKTCPSLSQSKTSASSGATKSAKHHDVSSSADSDDTINLENDPVVGGNHAASSHGNHDQSNNMHAASNKDGRPLCRYGSTCYRKNPSHLKEFRHTSGSNQDTDHLESAPAKKRRMIETATVAADNVASCSSMSHKRVSNSDRTFSGKPSPGNLGFMLTKVSGIEDKHNNKLAMNIKDILSASNGNLVKSAQFNYMTDIVWLVQQYPTQFRNKPVLIVHGCVRSQKAAMVREAEPYSQVQLCQAQLDIPYGTHHTKMMLLLYDEGLRVVIHTANLIQQDWFQKTQGIWLSPLFPKLPTESSTAGDSVTNFKHDLLEYLTAYKAPLLTDWLKTIRQHDMSSAKVYIVGSVPGRHTGQKKTSFGHLKLRMILQNSGPTKLHAQNWPVIGQFSSIGSLGVNKDVWVCGEWLESLAATRGSGNVLGPNKAKLNLIYPTKDNVRTSLEGYPAGGSLPYSINVAKKQPWLHELFCQWKSEVRGRSRASPHIKTYMRISPDWRNIAWFMVTSANLSKAAWGALEKSRSQLMIRSYELGVLFIPEHFDSVSSFRIMNSLDEPARCSDTKQLHFPLPYDMPPQQYTKQDRPWVWDIPYMDKPDCNGNMWCPS